MTPALEYLLSRPLLCTTEAAEVAGSIASRDSDAPQALEARKGVKMDGETDMYRRQGVAVLPVRGPIFRHANLFTELCGGATTESLARDLTAAVEDPGVLSILLDVDSPGGEAAGIGELAAMVRAATKVKPVCAYVGDQACSAAYWIASAASEVVCSETAQLGSIGVVMGMTVHSDRPGTKRYEFLSSQSPMKRPDPATEAGKANLQKRCDDLAAVFIRHVAGYRNTTSESVELDFGRGGVLTGADAVEAGMADSLGDFESTLARLSRGERLAARQPTVPKAKVAATESQKGKPKMSLYEKLFIRVARDNPDAAAAALKASGGDDDEGLAGFSAVARVAHQPAVDPAKLRADIKSEMEAEAKAKAESDAKVLTTLKDFFDSQANALVASRVEAGKLRPADVPGFKALFTELALLDHAGPLAADGKTVKRAPFLTSLVDGKSGVAWTSEHVASSDKLGQGQEVLPTVVASNGKPLVDQERVLTMLNATESGRASLSESKFKTA